MPGEIVQPKTYIKVFGALMGLLVLTVAANFINLGPFNVVVAMLISIAKGSLIVLFFMEVRYSHPIVWLFAAGSFLWLLLLLLFTMSDYTTRGWTGLEWRNETRGSNHLEFHQPH